MPPDPKVLRQHGLHVGVHLENGREVLQSKDLEVADQTEENTHKENYGRAIEPRAQLHDACDSVAHVDIAQERNL